jgi:hypothetical protein
MKKLLILILFPIYIFGQDSMEWTPVDYTLASTLIIGQVVDYGLTNYAIRDCGASEINPLFGKNPNMVHMALTKVAITATTLVMVKYLTTSTSQRRWALVVFNVITWIPVVMNINTLQKSGYSISLRFSL